MPGMEDPSLRAMVAQMGRQSAGQAGVTPGVDPTQMAAVGGMGPGSPPATTQPLQPTASQMMAEGGPGAAGGAPPGLLQLLMMISDPQGLQMILSQTQDPQMQQMIVQLAQMLQPGAGMTAQQPEMAAAAGAPQMAPAALPGGGPQLGQLMG